ncbi:hypothetical protein Efla_001380 [Eimeria flavescens]
MSVLVALMAHPMRSIIMELNAVTRTPASEIGGNCFAVGFLQCQSAALRCHCATNRVGCGLAAFIVYREMVYDRARRETREYAWEMDLLGRLPVGDCKLPLPGSILLSQTPASPQFLEALLAFHAVQCPEHRWVHAHGDEIR